jgi:uncharacterized protein (UPF0335 family)
MAKPAKTIKAGGNSVAADHLKSVVNRIERLNEEKKALSEDIKDIYSEAKSLGFDVKVIRGIIAHRKKDPATMEEYIEIFNMYQRALGGDELDL